MKKSAYSAFLLARMVCSRLDLNLKNGSHLATIFLLCDFKSVSLRRCETNKPPAMIDMIPLK